MPIAQLGLVLETAQNPGITQPELAELAEKFNMHSGTVSRNLKTLSIYVENGVRKGFDLIEMRPDLVERRKLACFLTARGAELVQAIVQTMEVLK